MTQPLTPYAKNHGALALNGGTSPATVPIMGTGSAPAAPAAPAPQPPPFTQTKAPYATNTPGFNGTGASPAYGSQSPTFLGTGQYVAPLFPINDQAITGNPQQNAGGNYGLNDVWNNLNKELAGVPTMGGGQATASIGGPASYQAATGQAALTAGANLGTGGNTIAQQANLAQILNDQAMGRGAPSAADLQLQQGAQQNLGAQLAAMGSQRGVTNAALMARGAADQAAASGANLNAQEGIQRAQETQAAQQAEGAVLGAQGSQAAGINTTAAGLQQETALANQAAANAMTSGNLGAINAANLGNAQLSQQQELANLGYQNQATAANQAMGLSNAQLQANEANAILGAQTGIGETNRAAATTDQQMQLQQMIAANQVNEQAFQAAANANGNLTGAIIGGVAGLGAAGINALGSGANAGAAGGGGANWTGPAPSSPDSGIMSTSSDGTFSGTLPNFNPAGLPGYTVSDENLKEGIEGGNPMMRSFLENYDRSTADAAKNKINVTEGSGFRNPTYGKSGGTASGGGGGIGSAIGGILGGLAGSIVAPGVGTAIGAGVGSQAGGAIGNGIDPASASGGGSYMANPGSGVTVDESGWDQSPDTMMASSDENEKQAVTSGNRGMSAFLQQANAQTNAQNKSGAQNNAFMASSLPPQAQVDTQLPNSGMPGGNYGPPPFMQQGGVTNPGGYQGAQNSTYGGVTPLTGDPRSAFQPVSQTDQVSLAMAHPQAPGNGGTTSPISWAVNMPTAPMQYTGNGLASFMAAQPSTAANDASVFERSGMVVSDERQKVTNTDGEPDPKTDARFGELGMLKRPDGDVSTEISITVTDPRLNGGAPTNIPTLVKGQKDVDSLLSGKAPTRQQEDLAIQRAAQRQKEGAYLPQFKSIPEAVSAAEVRSQTKGQMIDAGQDVLGSRPVAAPQASAPQQPFVPEQHSRRFYEAQNIASQYPEVGATVQSGPYAGLPSTFSGPPPSAAPPSMWSRLTSGLSSLSDEREKNTQPDAHDVQSMLDQLQAYKYRYKNPDAPGAMPGTRLGVMAQDLEKSKLGKQFVDEDGAGHKFVNYGQMAGTQLAASAYLNKRLDEHENMLMHLASERS